MHQIQLPDGRWIEVTANIFYTWNGQKKTKTHCRHVEEHWNEMYCRADAKYYNQMMES